MIFLLATSLVTLLITTISFSHGTHDAAVTDITLSYNTTVVFPTWENPLNISVTVKNNGSKPENINVAAYYNETQWTLINSTIVEIDSGVEENVTFTWNFPNLTGYNDNENLTNPDLAWPYPSYEIKANVTLAGDTNSDNDELVDGTVAVQWPGDCNGDGYINSTDQDIVSDSLFSQYPDDPEYDPRADFNGDGNITGLDNIILGKWLHRGPLEAHDVAVVNVTFSYNTSAVFPTWQNSPDINVTIRNKSWVYNESFTVNVYNDTTLIYTNSTELGPEAEETHTFSWDCRSLTGYDDNRTEAWPYPVYTITANASTVENETKIENNVYSANVTVQWPGDCNGDGYINSTDQDIVSDSLFSQYPDDPEYDSRADFNGDGKITGLDNIILGIWLHSGPLDRRDAAITDVTTSPDANIAFPSWENSLVIVTVKNNGTQTETFTVTAYYNTTFVIDTTQVNLNAGAEENVNFAWVIPNATWPYSNCTVSANVTFSYDENPNNDELFDGTLTVRWPGDANGDGYVNATDLFELRDAAKYYPYYDECADFDGDGNLTIQDTIILAEEDNWGHIPPS